MTVLFLVFILPLRSIEGFLNACLLWSEFIFKTCKIRVCVFIDDFYFSLEIPKTKLSHSLF